MWEAAGPHGHFFIRAAPVGQQGIDGVTALGVTRRWMNLLRGDRRWVVEVRRRDEDPFGPVVHSTTVASRYEARNEAERLAAALKSGDMPGERT
jgi:hypothetical protein